MLRDEHERLSQFVRRFTADMRQTSGLDVELVLQAPTGSGVPFVLNHAGALVGEWLGHPEADPLDWTAWLFDTIQHDWVIEQAHGAWPGCPRHAHPLAIRRTALDIVWCCPLDPGITAPVGVVATLVQPA